MEKPAREAPQCLFNLDTAPSRQIAQIDVVHDELAYISMQEQEVLQLMRGQTEDAIVARQGKIVPVAAMRSSRESERGRRLAIYQPENLVVAFPALFTDLDANSLAAPP